jgi:hypothetical protein
MSTLVSARKARILGGLILILWLAGVFWLIHQLATGTTPYLHWQETVVRTLVFSAVGSFLATHRAANPIGCLSRRVCSTYCSSSLVSMLLLL